MKKNKRLARKIVTLIQEKNLFVAKGAEEPQHVDNPGQTPMKDGPG